MGSWPASSLAILAASLSTPTTSLPLSARQVEVTSPTYPVPTTAIFTAENPRNRQVVILNEKPNEHAARRPLFRAECRRDPEASRPPYTRCGGGASEGAGSHPGAVGRSVLLPDEAGDALPETLALLMDRVHALTQQDVEILSRRDAFLLPGRRRRG